MTLGLVLASLLVAVGASADASHALNLQYCDQQIAGGGDCTGTDHSLTINEAANYFGSAYAVCAGAWLYGSYACGSLGYARHCYSGANLLTPIIRNNETFTQHMIGTEYWGAETC